MREILILKNWPIMICRLFRLLILLHAEFISKTHHQKYLQPFKNSNSNFNLNFVYRKLLISQILLIAKNAKLKACQYFSSSLRTDGNTSPRMTHRNCGTTAHRVVKIGQLPCNVFLIKISEFLLVLKTEW
jgi:hypothetical protein